MNKFKNATKRIVAIATSAALVSSSVFAGLGSYPTNFVKDGAFNGQVVMGAAANGLDSAASVSIIDDLKAELSGDSEKVKITYKSSAAGGESINAVRSNNELNYGEYLGNVTESAGFDDSDANVLVDGRFSNGVSDEDYTQVLKLKNGAFNYALRDNVNGVNAINNGIYYADGTEYAEFTLAMKTAVSLISDTTSAWDGDFIGETITIMGNDFTIGTIQRTNGSTDTLTKLELLGGANTISLGEGESTTVTIDGVSYEVSVSSVSASKVLLSVNGVSKSIKEFDTQEVSGVNVAVTDLVASSRDAVKGYAEIVIGGQKITLESGKLVKINDENIDDVYPKYEVYSTFSGTGLDTIVFSYKVSDDVLLEAGDSLTDPLFQAFVLNYDGTNNPEFTEVSVKVRDDQLDVSGTSEKGEATTISLYNAGTATTGSDGSVYIKGDQDGDRIFHFNSDLAKTNAADGVFTHASTLTAMTAGGTYTVGTTTVTGHATTQDATNFKVDASMTVTAENIVTALAANSVAAFSEGAVIYTQTVGAAAAGTGTGADTNINTGVTYELTSTGIKGSGFTILRDSEEQYLYELTSVDTTGATHEVDMNEWLRNADESAIQRTQWSSKLGDTLAVGVGSNFTTIAKADLGHMVAFENDAALMLTSSMESGTINFASPSTLNLTIALDNADINADTSTEEKDAVTVVFGWDANDNEFDISSIVGITASADIQLTGTTYTTANAFENAGMVDTVDGSSDSQTFVTRYGIMVDYDNKEGRSALIKIPKEQVRGEVSLVFGGEVAVTSSVTVDAANVDTKKTELTDAGNTIVSTETLAATTTSFDISAPVLDSSVTGMADMIVVGGPAVNTVAAALLGMSFPTIGAASGVESGTGMVKYFESSNSILVYGYEAADTVAAANTLNKGGLSGDTVNTQ